MYNVYFLNEYIDRGRSGQKFLYIRKKIFNENFLDEIKANYGTTIIVLLQPLPPTTSTITSNSAPPISATSALLLMGD